MKTTKRVNKSGTVRYSQLTHSAWNPVKGRAVPKVLSIFGRRRVRPAVTGVRHRSGLHAGQGAVAGERLIDQALHCRQRVGGLLDPAPGASTAGSEWWSMTACSSRGPGTARDHAPPAGPDRPLGTTSAPAARPAHRLPTAPACGDLGASLASPSDEGSWGSGQPEPDQSPSLGLSPERRVSCDGGHGELPVGGQIRPH